MNAPRGRERQELYRFGNFALYIETVSRSGYELIGSVVPATTGCAEAKTPSAGCEVAL